MAKFPFSSSSPVSTSQDASSVELERQLNQERTEADRLAQRVSELEGQNRLLALRANWILQSYSQRLTRQVESSIVLSQTVQAILDAVGEISSSYEEMLTNIQAIREVGLRLAESFQADTEAQAEVLGQSQAAQKSAEDELTLVAALRSDLGQLDHIREFMVQSVDQVDEIAAKLSLLSMNGRIEAAHAGSAGRGFAVVAQEMLKLQVESQTVIGSQRVRLGEFVPLMDSMSKRSLAVEVQAEQQKDSVRTITESGLRTQARTLANNKRVLDLSGAINEMAASIEQGEKHTIAVDEQAKKVEKIFREEVYVSKKVNDIDRFMFDQSQAAPHLGHAAQKILEEYCRLSVLNGKPYVWQAEVWLATDASRLPSQVLTPEVKALGPRVLVCVGQTPDHPVFTSALAPGIWAVKAIGDIQQPKSRLQGLGNFLETVHLTPADLADPTRLTDPSRHAAMACQETLEGSYRATLGSMVQQGALVCAFTFGGILSNGDFLVMHMLSNLQRTRADAAKFGQVGDSLILALDHHAQAGHYWET